MKSHYLLIDSSTLPFSVAISSEGKVIYEIITTSENKLARDITILIDEVCNQSEIKLSDLKAIAVAAGPGSYTGLRIGITSAKALCYVLNIPLIMIGNDEALYRAVVANTKFSEGEEYLISTMIEARRQEVYATVYNTKGEELIPLQPLIFPEDLSLQQVFNSNAVYILAGDGAGKILPYFSDRKVTLSTVKQQAGHLAALAVERYNSGQFKNLSTAAPIYLKPPNITTSKKVNLILKRPEK